MSAVQDAFRRYYVSTVVPVPADVPRHEFGYKAFNAHGYVRHIAYNNLQDFNTMLAQVVPSDVFCSNAAYKSPAAPTMQEKGMLGCELIFDIDGKDLHLPCEADHTWHLCEQCGKVLDKPAECPACHAQKFDSVIIPCRKCVAAAKVQVQRLQRILIEDLDVKPANIQVYFSGNNGFHIHVPEPAYLQLDAPSRAEIAFYASGSNFLPEALGVRRKGDGFYVRQPKGGTQYGWRAGMTRALKTSTAQRLENYVQKAGGYDKFKANLETVAGLQGAAIDPQVTSDVHRIFRMQNTLSGKSGLLKAPVHDLEKFDPFVDAVVLDDMPVPVVGKADASVRLRNKTYSVRAGKTAKLPAFAAVYMLLKGLVTQ